MRRAYRAANARGFQRCAQDIVLCDRSGAQCMRAAVAGGYCLQHAKMIVDKNELTPSEAYAAGHGAPDIRAMLED